MFDKPEATELLARPVRLTIDPKEEASAYAQRNNIPHQVFGEHERAPKSQAYADNFAFDRVEPWTH